MYLNIFMYIRVDVLWSVFVGVVAFFYRIWKYSPPSTSRCFVLVNL